VKLRLKFRGREMAHTDLGFNLIKKAVVDLAGMGHPDADPKLIGRNIHVMLTPLPVNKRKPKFHEPDELRAEHTPGSNHDHDNDDQEDDRDSNSDAGPSQASA
jgi:translation initiation factor IF-3